LVGTIFKILKEEGFGSSRQKKVNKKSFFLSVLLFSDGHHWFEEDLQGATLKTSWYKERNEITRRYHGFQSCAMAVSGCFFLIDFIF